MDRTNKQRAAYAAGAGLLLTLAPAFVSKFASAQAPTSGEATGTQADPLTQWPRQITSGTATITIYQPQLDRWQGNQLTGRAAVSVQATAAVNPIYGVLWFSARTDVDKEASLVTLDDTYRNKRNSKRQQEKRETAFSVDKSGMIGKSQALALPIRAVSKVGTNKAVPRMRETHVGTALFVF